MTLLRRRIVSSCPFVERKRCSRNDVLSRSIFLVSYIELVWLAALVARKGKFCKSETRRGDEISGRTVENESRKRRLVSAFARNFFNAFPWTERAKILRIVKKNDERIVVTIKSHSREYSDKICWLQFQSDTTEIFFTKMMEISLPSLDFSFKE